jgi:hypothetical protein
MFRPKAKHSAERLVQNVCVDASGLETGRDGFARPMTLTDGLQKRALRRRENGELEEEERMLVEAELYLTGMFDASVPWNAEGQPDVEVEGVGDVDGCTRRVDGLEQTGRCDGSVGPASHRIHDGPTVPVSIQEGCGSVVPFASAASRDQRDGEEPEDVGKRRSDEAVDLPRVAGRR